MGSFRRSIPALVLASLAGCLPGNYLLPLHEEAPTGDVCQVVATWNNQVARTPDPANGGKSTPGLVGRLYLFGPSLDYPMSGDGSVVIDLYDDTHKGPDKPQIPLERWQLDKDTLHRLLRKDPIGWGYTLFLPWGTYKPELMKIHMNIRYNPPHGFPIYSEGAPITLNPDERDLPVVKHTPPQAGKAPQVEKTATAAK
jgi:hypothetical protein